jgi:hypothetical protein
VGKARWPLSVSFHVPSNEHEENKAVPSPHVPTSHGAASRANSNLLALPSRFLAAVTATSSPCTSRSSGYYARRMHNYRTPVLLRAPFIRRGRSLLRPWSAGVQPPSAPATFRSTSARCGALSTDIPHCFAADRRQVRWMDGSAYLRVRYRWAKASTTAYTPCTTIAIRV